MNEENKQELDYNNTSLLFAIEVECKICGDDRILIYFDKENCCLIFKCGNSKCKYEDIVYL